MLVNVQTDPPLARHTQGAQRLHMLARVQDNYSNVLQASSTSTHARVSPDASPKLEHMQKLPE